VTTAPTLVGWANDKLVWSAAGGVYTQAAGGPAIRVTNLVVQNVPYKTVFLSHKFGLTTTSARVIGSGSALIASETGAAAGSSGTAVWGTWSKPGLHDVTAFLDASNTPIGFQHGTTWVVLAPPGTRTAVSGGRS